MTIQINVIDGDATRTECDALVTLINSGKMWFGGMDAAIMRTGGNQFHRQASQALDEWALEGDAIYTDRLDGTTGAYKSVIFVVDDLHKPLSLLVENALICASARGNCNSVVIPALRLGVMAGVVEKTIQETLDAIKVGIDSFAAKHPSTNLNITFVVYQNRALSQSMNQTFNN